MVSSRVKGYLRPHKHSCHSGIHGFFYKRTLFSAQPGVAYRKTVFEPQVCLNVCLTNQRAFLYEITKKVELYTLKLGNEYDWREKH